VIAKTALVEPAFANYPEYVETFGPEVADLCDLAGFPPDPEQELALNVLFGIDSRGRSVAFEFVNICARQNMKTGLMKQAALGWLFITDQRLITWSAHEMTPTREAFNDLVNLIENCPPLARRLEQGPTNGVFRGAGQESIALRGTRECPDGQRVLFKARTNAGGRGLTGNKIILDEGFALKTEHMGSLMPTLSAVPDPQLVIGSSACRPESDVLRRFVERGRSDDAEARKRLAYLEWCAPEDSCEDSDCQHRVGYPGCAMDNRGYVQLANPQAGRRITWEYLEGERDSLDPLEYGRERMGWHDRPALAGSALISPSQWSALADPQSEPIDPVSFGVYVSRGQANTAIAVAGYRADGKIHVGIVPAITGRADVVTLPGLGWIPYRIKDLADKWRPCAVVIDEKSEAGALVEDIQALGVDVEKTTATTMANACARFLSAVNEDELRHGGSPELQLSVCAGKARDLLDSWAWDRKDRASDITQLVAVTLALHGLIVKGRQVTQQSAYSGAEFTVL
jgi:hypothetical protein